MKKTSIVYNKKKQNDSLPENSVYTPLVCIKNYSPLERPHTLCATETECMSEISNEHDFVAVGKGFQLYVLFCQGLHIVK